MLQQLQKIFVSRIFIVSVALVIFSCLFYVSIAHATGTTIEMCVKDSGASYIIGQGFDKQSCKNNEQLLSFNMQGPTGPQGPMGPEGKSLKVYDANNTVIGYFEGFVQTSQSYTVFNKQLKAFHQINPGNNPPIAASLSVSTQYYKTTTCTGNSYIDYQGVNEVMLASVLFNNDGQFFTIEDPATETIPTPYVLDAAGVCTATGFPATVYKLKNVSSTLTSYVQPFRIGL
jgi:hypothetical protein